MLTRPKRNAHECLQGAQVTPCVLFMGCYVHSPVPMMAEIIVCKRHIIIVSSSLTSKTRFDDSHGWGLTGHGFVPRPQTFASISLVMPFSFPYILLSLLFSPRSGVSHGLYHFSYSPSLVIGLPSRLSSGPTRLFGSPSSCVLLLCYCYPWSQPYEDLPHYRY